MPLAAAWTLSAGLCLQALLGVSMKLRPASGHDIVHLGALEALVFVLGVFCVVSLHGGDQPLRASLGLRPAHPAHLVLGALLGFSLHFPAATIEALVQRFHPTPPEEFAARLALLSAHSTPRLVMVLLVVACVGPLVEELFFRGAIYGALRTTHSLFTAGAVTAVCFVVGHLDYYLWAPLMIVAVVMTHLRAMSGSLLPSLVTHVAFNAATVIGLVTTPPPAGTVPRVEVVPALVGSGITAILVALVQYVGLRAPEARRGRAEDAT
jgi:membrane protease YdiL (CAAX protease family)